MARGKPKNKKTCRVCGDRFMPNTGFQKYCSVDCRHKAELVTRQCKGCGKDFQRARSTPIRFCSTSCANRASALARAGRKGQFGNGKPKYPRSWVCAHCRAKFTQTSHTHRCCSKECSTRLSVENRRKTLGTIPPWGCKTKGEIHCRVCGYEATHLHHIVPRSKTKLGHRDMRNGLPLCRDCHYGWHHRTVVIYSDRLEPEERAFAVEITSEWWVDHNYPRRPYEIDTVDELPREEQVQIVRDCGGIANALGAPRRG